MTTQTNVATNLPQSYAITKSTPGMVAVIREALSNAKGKVFSVDDIKKLTGKKWVHGFVFYSSRKWLSPDAPEDFPIVSIKKGRKVVGYRHAPLADDVKRNGKGHMVKPTNVIGKWEQRLTQRALNAAKAAGVEVVTETAASDDATPVNISEAANYVSNGDKKMAASVQEIVNERPELVGHEAEVADELARIDADEE